MIEKYIPSRVGEPITAVDMSENLVYFGSISGYIGYYHLKDKILKYEDKIIQSVSMPKTPSEFNFKLFLACFDQFSK